MTFVVGFPPDGSGHAVLHLAAMLARSGGEDLLVATIVPAPWAPGPARVDAEYQAELTRAAHEALELARSRLPEGAEARYVVHHARSVPSGLLELAERESAELLVLGSALHGPHGQVTLGSVSDQLVHSSPLPVALAPRGFRCRSGCPVRRVSAAFGGTDVALVEAAVRVAARIGAQVRVVSFAVRPRAPLQAGVGASAEDPVVEQWERDVAAALGGSYEMALGRGATWEEALDDVEWTEGDVLVVGSSQLGPIARVFLGSRSSKIVRHSPVPCVVVPREALQE